MIDAFLKDIPFVEEQYQPRSVLLEAGRKADRLFYVKNGVLRAAYVDDGRDITLQFFFEGQVIASIESFFKGTASEYSIETIEATTVWVYRKEDILKHLQAHPEFQGAVSDMAIVRMLDYQHLFLSRIKDTPEQRYKALLAEHPEVMARVPQHYIASYLGITPVSLSRIRSRK